MQQRFHTRNISVRDFEQWDDRSELVLAPKFQRRDVWKPIARSYLIDTMLRGKPIPKLYMRQDINPRTRKATREIVDGQQRLKTALTFIKDGFPVSRAHSEEYGGCYFSDLDDETQSEILRYEFVVDLLEDLPDPDVYDVFARINTYAEKLKNQELRNAKWFGEFKSCVYKLATKFVPFFSANKIFTDAQILRMAEAEFISEILLAIHEGIREGKKPVIDKAYKDYDVRFENRRRYEKRFEETVDIIGAIFGVELSRLEFRATRLFYPLFCAVYHMQFRLPGLNAPRHRMNPRNYAKIKTKLEDVHELIENAKAAEKAHEDFAMSAEQKSFYEAYDEHWVHASNRTVLTKYLCKQLNA
jgi:hypothetical protein